MKKFLVIIVLLIFKGMCFGDFDSATYKADFETGFGDLGYIDNGAGSVVRSTDVAHRGNYSVKVTHSGNATTAIAKGTTAIGLDTYIMGHFYFPTSWNYWSSGPPNQCLKFLVMRGVGTPDREWYTGPYRNYKNASYPTVGGYDPDDYHILAFHPSWYTGDTQWTTDNVTFTDLCWNDACGGSDDIYGRYGWIYFDYPVTEDEWHYIESHYHHENNNNGYLELWIDDQYLKLTNLKFATSQLTNRYRWSLNDSTGASSGQYYYWDDCAIDDERIGPVQGSGETTTTTTPTTTTSTDTTTTTTTAATGFFRYPIDGGSQYVYDYYEHDGNDWNCGNVTYGGHRGTDFSLDGGFTDMDAGVDVVAAADGTVVHVHDGEVDRCPSSACVGCGGDECFYGYGNGLGNFIVIEHSDGIHTFYGHLRNGYMAVAESSVVSCGDKIGEVGSSGQSPNGPHLHFVVRTSTSYGSTLDPYSGSCSQPSSYWVSQGSYMGLPSTDCAGITTTSTTTMGVEPIALSLDDSEVLFHSYMSQGNGADMSCDSGYPITGTAQSFGSGPTLNSDGDFPGTYATYFESTNQELYLEMDADLPSSFPCQSGWTRDSFSACVQFKRATIGESHSLLTKYAPSVGDRGFALYINSSNVGRVLLGTPTGYSGYSTNYTFANTNTHSLCMSYDRPNSQLKIYADGSIDTTETHSTDLVLVDEPFAVGGRDYVQGWFMDGLIAEPTIWMGKIINSGEVSYYHISGIAPTEAPTTTVASTSVPASTTTTTPVVFSGQVHFYVSNSGSTNFDGSTGAAVHGYSAYTDGTNMIAFINAVGAEEGEIPVFTVEDIGRQIYILAKGKFKITGTPFGPMLQIDGTPTFGEDMEFYFGGPFATIGDLP